MDDGIIKNKPTFINFVEAKTDLTGILINGQRLPLPATVRFEFGEPTSNKSFYVDVPLKPCKGQELANVVGQLKYIALYGLPCPN